MFDTIGQRIKYLREKHHLNQSELAIQANSSNGMIGNIESYVYFYDGSDQYTSSEYESFKATYDHVWEQSKKWQYTSV